MALIVNIITITGPAEAVFDLVTTARFWPRWHPATLAVGGVTQRPFGLGDRIHERVRFGEVVTEGAWEVVEHARPRRSVLRIDRPFVQIAYTFRPEGEATELLRELEYEAGLAGAWPDPGGFDRLMREQSEEALGRLKGLVEAILDEEAAGLP
jgi:uncharacterized protein YndB with AHSA1/START domain